MPKFQHYDVIIYDASRDFEILFGIRNSVQFTCHELSMYKISLKFNH